MVPFDLVAGGDCVISNSGGVTHLRKGFKMFNLSVMQSSLCFADIESVTIPAICSVNDLRFLRTLFKFFAIIFSSLPIPGWKATLLTICI